MDKYRALRDAGTNGANFDLDTDGVIERLREWDAKYGITLDDVKYDSTTVTFQTLPDDLAALAGEIHQFCPDTVDQHFGCMAEMVELAEETGEDVPPDLLELMEGVNLEDEDYGVELLRRSLKKTRSVVLWWD
jgi:hypothetical protein